MATNKQTTPKAKASAKRSNPEPEVEVEAEVTVEPETHVAEHDPDDADSVAWRSAPHQTLAPSLKNSESVEG